MTHRQNKGTRGSLDKITITSYASVLWQQRTLFTDAQDRFSSGDGALRKKGGLEIGEKHMGGLELIQ